MEAGKEPPPVFTNRLTMPTQSKPPWGEVVTFCALGFGFLDRVCGPRPRNVAFLVVAAMMTVTALGCLALAIMRPDRGGDKDDDADEEARLIAAARAGDSRAFAALVDAHQQAVRGFLRRFAGQWADADDLAQEAFVTAWRKLSRFEGRSSFRSWVCGIGFRIARDARRAHGRAQVRDGDWLSRARQRRKRVRRSKIALQ